MDVSERSKISQTGDANPKGYGFVVNRDIVNFSRWATAHLVVGSGGQTELTSCDIIELGYSQSHVFRWFKFTLKPPNSITSGNLLSAIWDTSHWNFFVKFGLKTA